MSFDWNLLHSRFNQNRAKPSEMGLFDSWKKCRKKRRNKNYERFQIQGSNVCQEYACLSPIKSSSPPFLCPRTPLPPRPSRVWKPPRAPSGSWRRRTSGDNYTRRETSKEPKTAQSNRPAFLANRENNSNHKGKHNVKQQKTTIFHPRGRRRDLNRPPSPGNQ